MKNRSFLVAAVCISTAMFLFMTVEAFARIGGSRSFGSRGSRSMPTPEEFWTFSRPVGPGAWRLSAIQQTS